MNTYTNPIIFADYSDPDVVRVGDEYYMTASSFNYTPGLPILHSYDLVNWTLIGYAVKELGRGYDIPRHSEGVWAPSIRYYDGMLYIYYGMPDDGIYVVRGRFAADDDKTLSGYIYDHGVSLRKAGYKRIIWDKPVCVLEGKGLIDPCPFTDDDGSRYLIHAYAKSRIGFKSILGMVKLDETGLKAVTRDSFIYNGGLVDAGMTERTENRYKGIAATEPDETLAPAVTIEGPKVYKRNGVYYILAPAGGVRNGWQLALRAADIGGPYECRVVMHQGTTAVNGPHQGGLVSDAAGDDWFIHFQDTGVYGRVCHLQPVTWQDGWPVIGVDKDGSGCGEPVSEYAYPRTGRAGDDVGVISQRRYETTEDIQWLGNHSYEYCEIVGPDGNVVSKDIADIMGHESVYDGSGGDRRLKLQALNSRGRQPLIWECPNVLTRKLDRRTLEAQIRLDISALTAGDRTGMVFMGGEYCYLECERLSKTGWRIVYGTSHTSDTGRSEVRRVLEDTDTQGICSLRLRVILKEVQDEGGRRPVSSLGYALSDIRGDTSDIRMLDEKYEPTDHTWVGARLGVYAVSKLSRGGYTVIDDYVWRDI